MSDKGTELRSELGSGTNTTAAPPPGASVTSPSQNNGPINGGGSAEGNRGDGSSSGTEGSTTGTAFSQGGQSQAATFRGVSRVVALWSMVVGIFVGGMFTLL